MNKPPAHAAELPAHGKAQRLPGASREASVYDQLYRYAEDLQDLIEGREAITARYEALREAFDQLNANHTLFDKLVSNSHDIHLVTDTDGLILKANPAVACLADPSEVNGRLLDDWVIDTYHASFVAVRNQAMATPGEPSREMELHLHSEHKARPQIIVAAQAILHQAEQGKATLHWILRDITPLRETQFESQIATMVYQNASEAVMITDVKGTILSINPAFTEITGYQPAEVIGQTPRILKSGVQNAGFYQAFWRHINDTGSWQGEIYNRKKNGEVFPEWLTISAVRDADRRIISFIAVFSDLSKLMQTEKRLAHLALHDALTDLPNRLLLQERLASVITQAKRTKTPATLIFIDLDKFKPINDTLGHDAGDHALIEVANRLRSAVREMDTVARFGGDEFVILAPGLEGNANIDLVCTKIIKALNQPFSIGDTPVALSASLGCAEYPRHGLDEAALLKSADAAMYQAKAAGGNVYTISTNVTA